MGRRGPAPTPTKVKLLRGETRPSRLNLREPLPSRDVPKMPADMDPEAKVVWRRVLRDMRHTGVIRAADADVLRCYCEAVSRYAQAARLLAQSGPLVAKRDREPGQEPAPPGRPRQRRRDPPVRPRTRPVAVGAGGPADRARARDGLADRRHRPPAAAPGGRRCGLSRGPRCPLRRPALRRVLRALHPPHQGPLGRPAAHLRGLAARVLVGGARVRPRHRPPHLQRGRSRAPRARTPSRRWPGRRPLHARRRRRERARGLRRRRRPEPGRHRHGPVDQHGPASPCSCSIASGPTATGSSARATAGSCAPCPPTARSSTASTRRPTSSTSSTPTSRPSCTPRSRPAPAPASSRSRSGSATAGVAGEGILADLYESMFSGTGELEDRGSLLIYRDRVNGTLIYWYGAPRDADIEDPAVWFACNPRPGCTTASTWAPVRAAQGPRRAARMAPLPPQPVPGHRGRVAPRRGVGRVSRRPPAQRRAAGRRRHRPEPGRRARGDRRRAAPGGSRRGEVAGVRARVRHGHRVDRGDARHLPRAARRATRCRRPPTRRRSARSPGPPSRSTGWPSASRPRCSSRTA